MDYTDLEYSLAVFLKNRGYLRTLETFLSESPNMYGRDATEIGNNADDDDDQRAGNFDRLANVMRHNPGTYSLFVQSLRDMEAAMATMKYGLGLTKERPANRNLSTNHRRMYFGHSSTLARPLTFRSADHNRTISTSTSTASTATVTTQPRRRDRDKAAATSTKSKRSGATSSSSSRKQQDGIRMTTIEPPTTTSTIPTATPNSPMIETANQSDSTPVRQHFSGNRGRQQQEQSTTIITRQMENLSTPTRRQLFSSPSKRKTPNPKHQLTPRVERDLLDEALKQCSISPSDWERRLTDSVVPERLAAAINNAMENAVIGASPGGAPPSISVDAQIVFGQPPSDVSPLRPMTSTTTNHHQQQPSTPFGQQLALPPPQHQQQLSTDQDTNESQCDDFDGMASICETDAVVSNTLYQIGTNPDFFQSLEQLLLPENNNPDVSALDEELNRLNDLHTPDNFLNSNFDSPFAFWNMSEISPLAQFTGGGIGTSGPPRFVITPGKSPLASRLRSIRPATDQRLRHQTNRQSPVRRNLFVANKLVFGTRDEATSEPPAKKSRLVHFDDASAQMPSTSSSENIDHHQNGFPMLDFPISTANGSTNGQNDGYFAQPLYSSPVSSSNVVLGTTQPQFSIPSPSISTVSAPQPNSIAPNGSSKRVESTTKKQGSSGSLLTPDRIDALMKKLHKKGK